MTESTTSLPCGVDRTSEHLHARIIPPDGSAHLLLEGEVDIMTVAQFRQALDDAMELGTSEVHLDMSRVEFFGSEGISVLVAAGKAAAARGPGIRITRCSSMVHRVLSVTGLLEHFGAPVLVSDRPEGGLSASR